MLKGVSPLLSPGLLAALCRMGHGEELLLADAHFPADSTQRPVIRADGLPVDALLEAILPLFELDRYERFPLVMMEAVSGDQLDPQVEARYRRVLDRHCPEPAALLRLERFAFYERARTVHTVVVTGETAKYGNLILKKGVTPVAG